MEHKAVLISIRPKWCNLILIGEKTVEVRKNRPKLKTPFTCYIYMTAGDYIYRKDGWLTAVFPPSGGIYNGAQMIVAEFVCDYISRGYPDLYDVVDVKESCLTPQEISKYVNGKFPYFWHISALKIYDEPRPLPAGIKSPPQSWCYVSEMAR